MPEPFTFAAILTPPGRGALATIELRGPQAWEIAQECLTEPISPAQVQKNRPWLRQFRSSSGLAEELVVTFPEENVARIHCHGGKAACEAVLQSLEAAGATRSSAKKPTLTQALTERTALILLDQAQGAFNREISEISRLLERNCGEEAQERIAILLSRLPLGLHLTKPWRVVIAGKPNAGKSSLLNALLGFQRSITSAQPGTTRDVVTAVTAFDGWPFELRDTAGMTESDDLLEAAGVALSRKEVGQADLVLFIIPVNQSDTGPFDFDHRCRDLMIRSKADLADATRIASDEIAVSAITGAGLDVLIARIVAALIPLSPPPGAAIPITEDQIAVLRQASELLDRKETAIAIDLLRQMLKKDPNPGKRPDRGAAHF